MPALPERSLYFHAQYRQATPTTAVAAPGGKNLDGANNYVYAETKGRGHLMGVTLGVMQIADRWMGEGDDMIFVDDDAKPVITGTGSEDYFNGAWDFGGGWSRPPGSLGQRIRNVQELSLVRNWIQWLHRFA